MENELKLTAGAMVTFGIAVAALVILPYVQVRDVQGLDPVALVGADTVVVTTDAVKKIEEWLA